MKELELAKRFMLEYLPPAAQVPVMDIFVALESNPQMILTNGLVYTNLKHFRDADEKLAVAAINSFVAGFSLAYCLKFPESVRLLESFLENANKEKGLNVVNLLSKRK